MSSSREIRSLDAQHLHLVLEIEKASQPQPWPRTVFLGELERPWAHFWGLWNHRSLLGYIDFWHQAEEVHILALAVAPSSRRQGVASQLIHSCAQWARHQNAEYLCLEVRRTNIAALRFYRRLGFELLGSRTGYYRDTGEDALFLGAHLKLSNLLH